MLTSPPGFFADVGRHGFGAAWNKRFGHFTVGGRDFEYAELATWDGQQLAWLFDAAIREGNDVCACWVFEWMLIGRGGLVGRAWSDAMAVLTRHEEPRARATMERLLEYVSDPHELKLVEHNSWTGYLLGKIFADQAAQKSSKSDLQTKKKLALHFLGNARQRLQWETAQPSADAYRSTALAAALGVAVAAAYEKVAYLQWKGTRTTALAE